MLGLFIGIVVALLIFVVQEIRGNIARKKRREDISKDFERKLPVMIDIAWKTKYPDRPIPPRAKRIFEGVIKRRGSWNDYWRSGGRDPSDGVYRSGR